MTLFITKSNRTHQLPDVFRSKYMDILKHYDLFCLVKVFTVKHHKNGINGRTVWIYKSPQLESCFSNLRITVL